MYFQSKLLLDAKADPNVTNQGGHKALTGLEGAKTGLDAWDNPMNILKAAEDWKLGMDFLGCSRVCSTFFFLHLTQESRQTKKSMDQTSD